MTSLLAAFVTVAAMAATPAIGQQQPNPAEAHLSQLIQLAQKLKKKIPAEQQHHLSSGAQQLLALPDLKPKLQKLEDQSRQRGGQFRRAPLAAPPGYANDPNAPEDFLTRFAGSTQSEPSTAWCGKNALIGYNDTGSLISTLLNPPPSGNLSVQGWSRTTDADREQPSYTDMGALLADPLPPGVSARVPFSDPVLGCTTSSNFYYGADALDLLSSGGLNSGISVSRSADAGLSFQTAMAVSKDADTHFIDKPWLAVEPGPTASAADDIIHVAYTDFDFSGAPSCGGALRTAVEYVKSTDGGATWTAPQVIDQTCGDLGKEVIGAQVETGLGGNVYVAWERFDPDYQTRSIRIRRSVDDGTSFGATSVVSPVVPVGDGDLLQGLFRNGVDLQGLAVAPSNNALYVTWHDGRFAQQADPLSTCQNEPKYCFADVLFSKSTDGGATWSAPIRISSDPAGEKADDFQPALAVDSRGALWSLYYDRHGAFDGVERNFSLKADVVRSPDGGSTWEKRYVSSRFYPSRAADVIPVPSYMGDYNSIATDNLGVYSGAISAWGDNSLGDPNVRTQRVLPPTPYKPHPKPHDAHHNPQRHQHSHRHG